MKTYIVTGDRSYRETAPGDTFTANLSEAEEARAVSRGSIQVAGGGRGQQARSEGRVAQKPPAEPARPSEDDETTGGE